MKTKESEEMYLETILLLKKRKPTVRSVDIVEELGYAKSSVSRAVNLLMKNGFVTVNSLTGDIAFTEKGTEKARNIYERHRILTKALCKIGAEEKSAEENACRIEHVISDDLFSVIKKFVNED